MNDLRDGHERERKKDRERTEVVLYLVDVNAMAERPWSLEVVLDALLQLFGHLQGEKKREREREEENKT